MKKTLDKKLQRVSRNTTWEHNHKLIETAAVEHIKNSNKAPSYEMYRKSTGLSNETTKKHLKELNLDIWKPLFKPFTPVILIKLLKSFLKDGKYSDAKLLMQLIEDYREKTDVEHTIIDKEKLKKEMESIFE